jgi:hypothetical protein
LEGLLRGWFIGVEGVVPDQGEDRSEEQDAGEEVAGITMLHGRPPENSVASTKNEGRVASGK